MYKKSYLAADAAAAFQYTRFHFRLHLFSTSAARESGSGRPVGGPLAPRSKDKLPQVQSICFEHQSLPSTMSLMQSGYTWRQREGAEEGKKERGGGNTSRHRGDSFGTAGGLLGYHSLIAAVAPDVEWPGK